MADTPKDLQTTPQPDTDKNYFNFKATGLKINESYAIKFQWIYEDGTLSDWSPGYVIQTSNETAPNVPTATSVPETGTGSIPVTLSSFPANARRVDVYVTGGIFGLGKVAYSFTTAGTTTIAAPAGTYVVQLRSVSPTGVTSTVGASYTITISDVGETIQSPTNPNGFSSKRILAGIEVSWAGTYSNSTFTGFEAINIYAGNSASATPGTYEQVGVLTGNNVKNTIVIPLGTYVAYGQAVYIHAAAVNKNGTVGTIQANVTNQLLGPGRATDADINDGAVVISKLASDVLTVGNLKAGDINATSYIRAGTASSARVELASSTVGSVLPGFYIYNSAGTAVLSAPLSGGLSIVGNGTFTGDISGANGTFTGDLGASGGNFTVRSGVVTALAGNIGGWVINNNSLKSSAVAFPSIQLDPIGSKIELRSSAGSSDIGSFIKMDTTSGLRIGSGSTPKFSVSMDGILTASDVIISGNIIANGLVQGTTISGTIITGGSLTTTSDGSFGQVKIGGGATPNAIEFIGSSSNTIGQMYQFADNEIIIASGSRTALGYPASTWYQSISSAGITLGYSNSLGQSSNNYLNMQFGSASFGSMSVSSSGNGTLLLREFRNTIASTSTPSGSGYYIGDIWIQY
jgi:hypothetical protein